MFVKVHAAGTHAHIKKLSYRLILIRVHAVLWRSCRCRAISLVAGECWRGHWWCREAQQPLPIHKLSPWLTCHCGKPDNVTLGATHTHTYACTESYSLTHPYINTEKGKEGGMQSSLMLALSKLPHCLTCSPPNAIMPLCMTHNAGRLGWYTHTCTHRYTNIQLKLPEGLRKAQ